MSLLVRAKLCAALVALAGCAELGVVSDGTSISRGKTNGGYIVGGVRLPDAGDGFVTGAPWRARGNRYGTDELVDLITGVSRRLAARSRPRLVVADLSRPGGGEAHTWHRSHQSGRDVDLLYFVRDASGAPAEPDQMHPFDRHGRATDGSGYTLDVPRTWALVRELLTAREAAVQWVFCYRPICERLIEYAVAEGEPDAVIAKARLALEQPGRRAPHKDHMHVRIYCTPQDRAYGCVDFGPTEMLALWDAERTTAAAIAASDLAPRAPTASAAPAAATSPVSGASASATAVADPRAIGRVLRAGLLDRIPRHWR